MTRSFDSDTALEPLAPGRWRASVLVAGGFWEEDGEVWSADGTLLAHSRQLAIVRAPRP